MEYTREEIVGTNGGEMRGRRAGDKKWKVIERGNLKGSGDIEGKEEKRK